MKSWSLYQDLQIPLSKYIEVIEKDSLDPLIISGQPTDSDLIKAWNNINELYAKSMGGGELTSRTTDVVEYEYLDTRDKLGRMYLEMAKARLSPEIIEGLKLFGFPLPEVITEENKVQALNLFVSYMNKEGLQLDKLTEKLSKSENVSDNVKPTRDLYVKVLVQCSLAFGCAPISVNQINLEQYVEYSKQLESYAKSIEKQNNHLKR